MLAELALDWVICNYLIALSTVTLKANQGFWSCVLLLLGIRHVEVGLLVPFLHSSSITLASSPGTWSLIGLLSILKRVICMRNVIATASLTAYLTYLLCSPS
jgi:hypothetical protein